MSPRNTEIHATRIIVYFILSLGWFSIAYFAGEMIPHQPLWFALFITLLFGLPLFLAGSYASTVHRIYKSSQFRHVGILHWFSTRRILANIGWIIWSLAFAFILLVYIGTANPLEWISFLATIPIFAIISTLFTPISTKEYKPYIAVHKTLAWSRWVTALVMSAFFILLIKFFGENRQYETLTEAVQTESAKLSGASNSIFIHETTQILGFVEGAKQFTLSNLSSLDNGVYLAAIFLGSVMIFYNITLAISSFMVPLPEYRRILIPVQDTDIPARIPPRSLAITSAFVAFFVVFIYVPSFLHFDGWLRSNPESVEQLRTTQQKVIQTVEMIGNDYYKPGTSEQIEKAYFDSISKLDTSIQELREATKIGFQKMANNVDDYLDWYYSLPGEYERIMALASGALEEWMVEKLQHHLMKGNAFGPVQQSIENAIKSNEQLRIEHQDRVKQILAENSIEPADLQLEIIKTSSLDALKEPPSHSVIVNLENRMLISGSIGATGAITGAIAGKITAKVVGKGAIKLGAQALIKITAGKAVSALGGTAAGAATGMAIGSVVPGIGTAIGAAIGGIAGGLTIGLTVEKLLLMLEEAFSREEFKQQILQAIEEERVEFEKSLEGALESKVPL